MNLRTEKFATKCGIAGLLVFMTLAASASTVQFKPAQIYAVSTNPTAVAVGDFNGDGKLDIAVANNGSSNISILLGNGDGTFQPAVNFDVGVSPNRIVVADINGDGKPDIAVLVNMDLSTSAPGAVSILLGAGDGTFQPPIVLTLTLQQNPFTLLDVNGDKKADLIINLVDSYGNPVGASVSLGNGDGTFQTANTVANAPGVAEVSDFNNDGKPDLVVPTLTSEQLMYGNGDGTFSAGPQFTPSDGEFLGRVLAADLNGDHQLDLILESSVETGPQNDDVRQDIGVFLSNGNGFGSEDIFLTGTYFKALFKPPISCFITDIVTGDFNGDGKADVANRAQANCSNPSFAVNLGDGAGNFTVVPLTDPGPLAAAADLNGDQLTDLIVLDAANNNSIAVLVNATPAFSMTPASNTLTASASQQVTDMLTFAAANGFSSTIHLSCQVTGPAPAPTCSLSPASITAVAGASTSTLTIGVPATAALASPLSRRLPPVYALALPFAFVGLGFRRKRVDPRYKMRLLTASLATAALMCTACGGASSNTQSVHQPQSYTVQVTAASDSLTKAMQISLTVQ